MIRIQKAKLVNKVHEIVEFFKNIEPIIFGKDVSPFGNNCPNFGQTPVKIRPRYENISKISLQGHEKADF